MTLTPSQQATLKAHILATPALDSFPNNEDGADSIANLLNEQAAPAFTVWKSIVPVSDLMDNIDTSSQTALQTAESNTLISLIAAYQNLGINPSLKRDIFIDATSGIFNGGANNNPNTRLALETLFKRLSNEIEKLFATGTGTDIDPATMTFTGNISRQDVFEARNS